MSLFEPSHCLYYGSTVSIRSYLFYFDITLSQQTNYTQNIIRENIGKINN